MLIKCPECEREISDKARTCIHCGYPLRLINQQKHSLPEIREKQLWKNPFYEYMVEVVLDNPNGTVDDEQIEEILDKYSEQGWRLHSIFTDEIGKNDTSISIRNIGKGANATINQTVMIFERCTKPEV